MGFTIPNFAPAYPEIFVLIMACATLMVSVFSGRFAGRLSYFLVQLTLIVAFCLSLNHLGLPKTVTFSGMFINDNLSVLLKLFIYFTSFLVFIYSRHYIKGRNLPQPEYFILGLFWQH